MRWTHLAGGAMLFAAGLACGRGSVRQKLPDGPSPAPGPTAVASPELLRTPADFLQVANDRCHARDRLTAHVLERLGDETLSDRDRGTYIASLGLLGSPDAVDYLLAHMGFSFDLERGSPSSGAAGRYYPCLRARREMGLVAVPRVVEAYLMLPADRVPELLLDRVLIGDGRGDSRYRTRVAHLYAHGLAFVNPLNDQYRQRAEALTAQARGQLGQPGDTEFPDPPPPWMQPPMKK